MQIVIENNFKYSTVISTFSKHITIFRTFDKSNFNNAKQIKQKMANFFCKLFGIIKFFFLILLRKATLESKVAVVFHFFTNFFGTNFRHQNKSNVVETIS